MDDALFVRGLERVRNLACDGERVGERQRAARDDGGQVVAVDQFHHECTHGAGLVQPVNVGDVRVIQRRQGLRLAREPDQPFRIERKQLGQHLDRYVAIELRIASAINLAHSAGA